MNKLFKLIMVNLLGLFDINKIKVARMDGVKSNLEKKTVMTGLIAIIYGYLIYHLFLFLNLDDKMLILNLGFIVSTILCLGMDLWIIEPIIFKNKDNEMLFSLPVTRQQILFSKLFVIYLRNLVFTGIIMLASIFSYGHFIKNISDTFIMMYILSTLIIPFIPIVISTIISYVNDYFKLKSGNNIIYKIIKLLIIIVIILFLLYIFKDVRSSNIDSLISSIINKIYYIYPLSYLFNNSLRYENIIYFIILIVIPIVIIYIYSLFISKNYLKICSLLKGIEKKEIFKYKKTYNLHKVFGLLRKELNNLFSNKFYLRNSFGGLLSLSVLLLVVFLVFDISKLYDIENFDIYINLYVPTLLCLFSTATGSAISSMSLEKENMQMLRTMPISMTKILLGKWLTNIIIGGIFVIINGTIIWYFLDLSKWGIIFSYLLPFVALLFISFTSLILDYRFIEKNELDDNSIIKQRFLVMVPSFLSIIISFGPFFIPVYRQYKLLLGSYVLALLLLVIIEYIYLLINRNKLIRGLFN